MIPALGEMAGLLPAAAAPAGEGGAEMWLRFLGRLHPLLVHFPLALIITALAVESASLFRRDHRVSRTAVICLTGGAVTAVLAAWFGWLNADHEPHGSSVVETLTLHRWAGVGATAAAVLAALLAIPTHLGTGAWARRAYLLALSAAAALVVAGGFLGGELVHGRGYLTAVLREVPPAPEEPPAIEPVLPVPVASATAATVEPIFAASCAECHGPDRRKAGLQLVPIAAAFAGDREDWVIRPSDPAGSLLLERVRLPAGHPDLMPRDGDPLAPESIALIEAWIAAGAPLPARPSTEPEPPAVTPVEPEPAADPVPAEPPEPPAPEAKPEPDPEPEPAPSTGNPDLDALIDRGASITAISRLTGELDVSLSRLDPPATDADVVVLVRAAGADVAVLDLSGAPITDAALDALASCARLRQLRLDGTGVTDAGVARLGGLQAMTHLNLNGTGITDASLDVIGGLEKLERLHVYETGVTVAAVAKLRVRRPSLRISRTEPG